ncbi:hypothetical protein QUB52_10570 [Microcoleus sp. A6-C6]
MNLWVEGLVGDRPCQARNRVSCVISRDSSPKLVETRFLRVRNWRYQVGEKPGFLVDFS